MKFSSTRRQALAFALTLGAAAVLAEALTPRRRDVARSAVALEALFPSAFADWRSDDAGHEFVQPADDLGRRYGFYDQVLERAYVGAAGERVMLSVAYGSEQSPSMQLHRPEVCYRASGFRIAGLQAETLDVGARRLAVTRLHASMVGRSEPITYWTLLAETVIGSGSDFLWRQLAAGLSGEVRDGMLVRVSSIDQDAQRGYRLHERFASDLARAISPDHIDRVFGAIDATG